MTVLDKPLSWYIEKIKNNEYFSQGMYGDGEWIAMFHTNVGGRNAEETEYTKELCDALEKSLHFKSPNFFFSAPAGLKRADTLGEKKIDAYLRGEGLKGMQFYEKDVWDKEAREGGLREFIEVIKDKTVVVISNKHLRRLPFYDHFIEVSYPNCFQEKERVEKEILEFGRPGVYLFSCGLPASIFVQSVHNRVPGSYFLDVGSIWDAFVGIGAQRGWRKELYEDREKYEKWKALYEGI